MNKNILPYINDLIFKLQSPYYDLRCLQPKDGVLKEEDLKVITLEASCEILGEVAICVRCFEYPLLIPYGKSECFYTYVIKDFLGKFHELRLKKYSELHNELLKELEIAGYFVRPTILLGTTNRLNLVIRDKNLYTQISIPARHIRYNVQTILANVDIFLDPEYNYRFRDKIIDIEDFPFKQ